MAPRISPVVNLDPSQFRARFRSSKWDKSMRYSSASLPKRYPLSTLFDERLLLDYPKRSPSISNTTIADQKTVNHLPNAKSTSISHFLRINPSEPYWNTHQTRRRRGARTESHIQTSKPNSPSYTAQPGSETATGHLPSFSSSQIQLRSQPELSSIRFDDQKDISSKTQFSSDQVLTSSKPSKSLLSLPPRPSLPPPSQPSSTDTAAFNPTKATQFESLGHPDSPPSSSSSSSKDTAEIFVSPPDKFSKSARRRQSLSINSSPDSSPREYQLSEPLPASRKGKTGHGNSKEFSSRKTSQRPFESTPLERERLKNGETDHQKGPERQSELAKLRSEWRKLNLDAPLSLDDLPLVDGTIESARVGLYIQALRDQQTILLNRFSKDRELVLRALDELPNSSVDDSWEETARKENSEGQITQLAPEPIRKLWLAKNEKDVRAVMKLVQTIYQSGRVPVLPTFYEDLSVTCKRLNLYHLLGEVVVSSDDYGLEPPPARYLSSLRGLLKHLIGQEISTFPLPSFSKSTTANFPELSSLSFSHSNDSSSKPPLFRLSIPLLDQLFVRLPFDPVLCALSLQALSILSSTSPSASLRFASLQESLLTSDIPSSWTVRVGKDTWWSGLSPAEIKLHSAWLLEALDSIRSSIPPELASLWKAGIPSPGLDFHRARLREVFLLVDQAKPKPYTITLDRPKNPPNANSSNDDNSSKDIHSQQWSSTKEDNDPIPGLPKALPLVPRLIESFLDSPLSSHHSDPVIVLFSLGIRMKLIPDELALREIHWTVKNLPKLAKAWDKVFASTNHQTEGAGWISERDRVVAEACLRMVEELLKENVGLWQNGLSLVKCQEKKSIS